MNNQIDINKPIATIIDEHPELLPLLVEIGFTPLESKTMINSVGRVVSIKRGANIISVPIEKIIQELEWNGYEVIGGDSNDK